jgi:hypothetical protein
MNKFILPLLIIVLVIVGVIGWSFLNKPTSVQIAKNYNTTQYTPTLTNTPQEIPLVSKAIANTTPLKYANPSVVIDAFETAIPAKKYNDLLPFMMENVNLIKYATSCCGIMTKDKAVNELSYLNSATQPWNFSDKNPIALKLEANDPEHFKEMWIGTSADFHAVGIKWNDDFLIEKISLVNDYRLITGE